MKYILTGYKILFSVLAVIGGFALLLYLGDRYVMFGYILSGILGASFLTSIAYFIGGFVHENNGG